MLDHRSVIWQKAAELAADTSKGWARLLGEGQPVVEACLRRELAAWKAGLTASDPTPLVTAAVDAAVDAAGVVWLSQRYAERELFAAGENNRAAASRRLAISNRQLQESLRLVIAARAAADPATTRTAPGEVAAVNSPRLLGGTA